MSGSHDKATSSPGLARIQMRDDDHTCRWLHCSNPVRILSVHALDQVLPALQEAEQEAQRGRFVVCFMTYEASPAFDAACRVHPSTTLPLAWFGIYEQADLVTASPPGRHTPAVTRWSTEIGRTAYEQAITQIRAWIAAGDTYQVNYTTRLTSPFSGSPEGLFSDLLTYQPRGYAAYVDIGDHVLCSLSPELFFSKRGRRITCRPMKGTTARGVTNRQDRARADALRNSEKDRAENVMIVDMIRNDLGRVATPGTVTVERLYDIERYRTVFQMTSTVTAETGADIPEIFAALFPCASITGAPKIRTMELIRKLETSPRGIYTGCIGVLQPDHRAQFNVAIRTVHIDRTRQLATYGTGGGIVWDSTASGEYHECLTKALVLRPPPPHLHLLETLRWTPEDGFFLLSEHLERVLDSAHYFDIHLAREAVNQALFHAVEQLASLPHRIRLLVSEDGSLQVQSTPIPHQPFCAAPEHCAVTRPAVLAHHPVDPTNRFLYHKTTRREVYDQATASAPDDTEVLLWNTRGEVTECSIANIVAVVDGRWLTPATSCGALGGTYRRFLLEQGRIEETVLPVAQLPQASDLLLINSVRGWVRANLHAPTAPPTLTMS